MIYELLEHRRCDEWAQFDCYWPSHEDVHVVDPYDKTYTCTFVFFTDKHHMWACDVITFIESINHVPFVRFDVCYYIRRDVYAFIFYNTCVFFTILFMQ